MLLNQRYSDACSGFIAAFGQLGAAIFPFCTGALAQRTSPAALQPVMVTLLAVMMAIWVFVKDAKKKTE
jgi:nitrate/nitrite transporter NarK